MVYLPTFFTNMSPLKRDYFLIGNIHLPTIDFQGTCSFFWGVSWIGWIHLHPGSWLVCHVCQIWMWYLYSIESRAKPKHSLRIHVWYIYLHLVDFYGKCREIYHTWILRDSFKPRFLFPWGRSQNIAVTHETPRLWLVNLSPSNIPRWEITVWMGLY